MKSLHTQQDIFREVKKKHTGKKISKYRNQCLKNLTIIPFQMVSFDEYKTEFVNLSYINQGGMQHGAKIAAQKWGGGGECPMQHSFS